MDVARGTGTQTIAVYVPDDETLVMLRQYGIGYGQGKPCRSPAPRRRDLARSRRR